MKIIFFGTTDFAVKGLEALLSSHHEVVAVVTTPDRPQGRHYKLVPCAVKECAVAHNLPVLEPEKLRDEAFVEALKSYGADLFVVIAFRMLPEVVWNMPRLGTINIHGSLLPAYRGAAPINRAIMAGETVSGVSAFNLDKEIDTGDVIGTRETVIGPDETFGEVYGRLGDLGAELLIDTVNALAAGTTKHVPQQEISSREPSPAPKIFNDDCRIDWRRKAEEIHNQVRGLSPTPGAVAVLDSDTSAPMPVKILRTRIADAPTEEMATGSVIITKKSMKVKCGDGWLDIISLQPQGKKEMPVQAYLNGARLLNPRFVNND